MKVLIQFVKNPEVMKVYDGVSMVTWRPDGRPVIHNRDKSVFTLELDTYKVVSIS